MNRPSDVPLALPAFTADPSSSHTASATPCNSAPVLCAPVVHIQAQFVAALRAALKPCAAPALAVCGGTLATTFLSAGLAAGDGAVMRRLMDLLVAPLQVCGH